MKLAALQSFQLLPFLDTVVSLATAFVLGTLIGAERQFRQRTAGLRTNVLVAVGAAAFVDIGMRLNGVASGAHVLAYVVSGVGFLGAGVIMREGLNIRGLNTAATLWGSAAVGATAGADFIAEAMLIAVLVIAANTALRPLVNLINRQPLDETTTEATYELHVSASPEDIGRIREVVEGHLERHNYAVRETSTEELSEETTELSVMLAASTAKPGELEAVIAAVGRTPGVRHATWSMRTSD
jgi:putative Mg2+ transporter-C (MgtC) family protein